MPFLEALLGIRRPNPAALIDSLNALAADSARDDKKCSKILGKVRKCLVEGCKDESQRELLRLLVSSQRPMATLVAVIFNYGPEPRRLATVLLQHLFASDQASRNMLVDDPDMVGRLVRGYEERPEVALCCGQLLRDFLQDPRMVKRLLSKESVLYLLAQTASDKFDSASDACMTIKVPPLLQSPGT